MDFRFDEKTHTYYLGDKRLTGITTILGVIAKPALIGWAAKEAINFVDSKAENIDVDGMWGAANPDAYGVVLGSKNDWGMFLEQAKTAHTKKKEAAGVHGTDAHLLVEEWIGLCIRTNDAKPIEGEVAESAITKFISWAQENVGTFLFSERRMFNAELFIAGTADFAYIGKDGKRYMADFKTSSGIYGIDYFLQVAAYRLLAEAEGDTPYDGATIVRLGKTGEFEVQQRYDYETDKEAFLACLTLYRAQGTYKN